MADCEPQQPLLSQQQQTDELDDAERSSPKYTFVDGCPGCLLETRKLRNKGPLAKELFFVAVMVLCNCRGVIVEPLQEVDWFAGRSARSGLESESGFMVNPHGKLFCPGNKGLGDCGKRYWLCAQETKGELHVEELECDLVKDFHITSSITEVAFYAGFIGSAFMAGRFLSSAPWGVIADKYGRKPVLICGTASMLKISISQAQLQRLPSMLDSLVITSACFSRLGSAFMAGRFLSSAPWGVIADKYGRKPVLICGTASM
ncbi:hypothetical protein L7F22_004037 [Adiantum nelumboides]|nr:hypothetical protein [Adiantum nelumboides]